MKSIWRSVLGFGLGLGCLAGSIGLSCAIDKANIPKVVTPPPPQASRLVMPDKVLVVEIGETIFACWSMTEDVKPAELPSHILCSPIGTKTAHKPDI